MKTDNKVTSSATVKATAAHCLLLAAASIVTTTTVHAQTAVQQFRQTIGATVHLSKDRGPLRHVDLSPFKGQVSREILAGPTNGLDSAFIVYTRRAAGAPAEGLYTLPVEQTYLVLKGKLNVQIGTDRFEVAPDSLVRIPPGVPHEAWNANGQPESDLDVVTPAPSRNLVSMMQPATARKVADAAQYVRVPPPLRQLRGNAHQISFNERVLASRAMGSPFLMERLGEVLPGAETHPFHIHPFDQVYFIKRGRMTFYYGLKTYEVPADTLIVIPAGVVHTDHNDGPSVLSFAQLIIPQPKDGVPFAAGVVIQKSPPGAGKRHGHSPSASRSP